MILLGNFKISESRLVCNHDRGNLKAYPERIEIAKYTLASYVPLLPLISKVVLYISLDTECEYHKDSFEEFIKELFPENKLILKWKRNTKVQDWRNSYTEDIEPIDDDLIFNMGNDDHLFIDSNLDVLTKTLEHLTNHPDPYAQIIYSHWPEFIRRGANAGYTITPDNVCTYGPFREFMATDVMKKERWRHYWFDPHQNFEDVTHFNLQADSPYNVNVINGDRFFRTDVLVETEMFPSGSTIFVPIKEQIRHFDGYNNTANWSNLTPPLEIPLGFFEKNIRIAYGYDTVRTGWVNINPAHPTYKAFSNDGMDYKFALEDIPAAWQGYISEIDINPDADLELLREERDKHFYDKAFYPIFGKHIDTINTYNLEVFKDYFISQKYIKEVK